MRLLLLALFCGCQLLGQLTADQKTIDLQDLAATFAKQYGPYEWKRDHVGFDLMNLTPWLNRAAATTNDLDFYEVMAEYVASLNDTHSLYLLPSNFTASLGFSVDIYDGKVLVDQTNSAQSLTGSLVNIGDEIVSIDGVSMQDLIPAYSQYHRYATARASARYSANSVVNRAQVYNPYAVNVPATSAVTVNRVNGGTVTVTIPWTRSGLPLQSIDPVSPLVTAGSSAPNQGRRQITRVTQDGESVWPDKSYLDRLQTMVDPLILTGAGPQTVTGYGNYAPVFNPPSTFAPRLGTKSTDSFISGTFTSGAYKFGFIRIPSYNPVSTNAALTQFAAEMAYFQQNVDGLVIDQMRNPGGSGCYAQNIVSYLMSRPFRALGFELRATRNELIAAYSALTAAQALRRPQPEIDQYQFIYDQISQAYQANRGHTVALPLCGPSLTAQPATDSTGALIDYTKPLVFLIDEFSTSAGDAVPAMLQDNGRGPLVGYNTNGAGGSVGDGFNVGPYSEGTANVTLSLMVRKDLHNSPFGPTAYIENVGVAPDVVLDYMTRDNLLNGGRTFLNQVITVLTQHVQSGQ